MSNDPQQAPTEGGGSDDLQFDRVEPAAPQGVGEPIPATSATPAAAGPGVTVCAACGEPITDVYFEARGKVVCPRCRDAVIAAQAGGSGTLRFTKAVLLGAAACLAGAAVWWGVRAATNSSWGILAVLVGYGVGTAVRHGSGGRGGPPYQVLAVVLTYLSIALSWVPVALRQFWDEGDALFIALNTIVGSLTQPVVGSSVIGWLILGFALWEAVRINRRSQLTFNGPYRLAGAPPAFYAPPPVAGGR